jgi:cytosine/creatinine deaminase
VLSGVLSNEARQWFDLGAEFVDIIGGLPAKDGDRSDEHLDVILDTAKRMGKLVHIHVDQNNTPAETEMERLAEKTIEHGMQGNVVAVHGISVAAHPIEYREDVYSKILNARISVIACPTAWIDGRRTETRVPTHNSITPLDEMLPRGVAVAIGTDNINDVYKPFSTGDIMQEVWLAAEAARYYDIDQLVAMATINGLKVLKKDYTES